MLRPERFASFETPNVIDPGDAPPTQPKKPKQIPRAADTVTAPTTISHSDRRVNLSRTEKISFGGGNEQDDPMYDRARGSPHRLLDNIHDLDVAPVETRSPLHRNDDDEEAAAAAHSLPSIDDARNYAASLLQDANRRTSSRDLMVTQEMAESSSSFPSKHLVRNRVVNVAGKLAALVVVLILVILALVRLSS